MPSCSPGPGRPCLHAAHAHLLSGPGLCTAQSPHLFFDSFVQTLLKSAVNTQHLGAPAAGSALAKSDSMPASPHRAHPLLVVCVFPEGAPLPRPENGLSSNTGKRSVQGNTHADKAKDYWKVGLEWRAEG